MSMEGKKRKSGAVIGSAELRIRPPRGMSAARKRIWERVVAALPDDAMSGLDVDVLAQYTALVIVSERVLQEGDLALYKQLAAQTSSHATRLGITRQSRQEGKTRANAATHGQNAAAARDGMAEGEHGIGLRAPSLQ